MAQKDRFYSPGAIVPGHHAIPGTRIPPSQLLYALPPRSPAALPPSRHSSMCGPAKKRLLF